MYSPSFLKIWYDTFLAQAARLLLPPMDFGLFQIAYAAGFPDSDPLPDWAWSEYTIIAEQFATHCGAGFKFRQRALEFQRMQKETARASPGVDRLRFPEAGPLGSLLLVNLPPIPQIHLLEKHTPTSTNETVSTSDYLSPTPYESVHNDPNWPVQTTIRHL